MSKAAVSRRNAQTVCAGVRPYPGADLIPHHHGNPARNRVFGASSLHLVLKVGMTVSASIPVAVLSITLFKTFSKVFGLSGQATILENNIVQDDGLRRESRSPSASASRCPRFSSWATRWNWSRIMLVAILGGLLGVFMMIPLRRALIVDGHKELVYPEGTACAEVLIVGEKGRREQRGRKNGFRRILFLTRL